MKVEPTKAHSSPHLRWPLEQRQYQATHRLHIGVSELDTELLTDLHQPSDPQDAQLTILFEDG